MQSRKRNRAGGDPLVCAVVHETHHVVIHVRKASLERLLLQHLVRRLDEDWHGSHRFGNAEEAIQTDHVTASPRDHLAPAILQTVLPVPLAHERPGTLLGPHGSDPVKRASSASPAAGTTSRPRVRSVALPAGISSTGQLAARVTTLATLPSKKGRVLLLRSRPMTSRCEPVWRASPRIFSAGSPTSPAVSSSLARCAS